MVQLKRIYEQTEKTDGYRILVDRLWPRGVAREKAAIDLWLKEIAPSTELRTWFNHEPAKFAEFSARYESELHANPAAKQLRDLLAAHKTVTLLYAAHDPKLSHAPVLQKFLRNGR